MDQTIRTCVQCNFIKQNGERCKLKACTTPEFCWIHFKKIYNLRVKPSQIERAGKGLFTEKDIENNEELGEYKGEKLSKKEINKRYPGNTLGQYAIHISAGKNKNKYIDARSTQSNVFRYANDCRGTNFECNATFTPSGKIKTTTSIKKGNEIFISYGDEYWNE